MKVFITTFILAAAIHANAIHGVPWVKSEGIRKCWIVSEPWARLSLDKPNYSLIQVKAVCEISGETQTENVTLKFEGLSIELFNTILRLMKTASENYAKGSKYYFIDYKAMRGLQELLVSEVSGPYDIR